MVELCAPKLMPRLSEVVLPAVTRPKEGWSKDADDLTGDSVIGADLVVD